ncbi:hypothetical protein EVAR_46767_1 [Eumeta japonica]|uniref:Uncharacterized protein n=1 Tax=Eumeta variegata TaxID=151549 RepID=A0A4C2AAB0_EUMVA|nr:hypothetical protein EVAR_46767_1 [Eumeta japonica]
MSSGLASRSAQVALIQVVMAGDLVRRGDCDGRSSRVIVRHWMSRSTPACTFISIGGPDSHWHNFQQRFDSPVPIFVTVSLTADSFGARPRGSRVAARARMEQRMVAAVTLCAAFRTARLKGVTRGELMLGRALRTLCRHFGLRVHFEGFTSPRCALGYPPGASRLTGGGPGVDGG